MNLRLTWIYLLACFTLACDPQVPETSQGSADKSVTIIETDSQINDGFDESNFEDGIYDEDIREDFSEALKDSLSFSSVEPKEIYQQGGDTLTIKGKGFIKDDIKVFVEGIECLNLVVKDPKNLSCKTPNNMNHEGLATVVIMRGTDEAEARQQNIIEVIGPPYIDELLPAEAESTGGAIINIKGRNLNSNVRITFQGADCPIEEFYDTTSIACRVPEGIVDSLPEIKIMDRKGQFTIYDGGFKYLEPAYITEIEPNLIPMQGNVEVTLRGAGFRAGAAIWLGAGQCRDPQIISRTEAKCTAPSSGLAGLPNGGPFKAQVVLSTGRIIEGEGIAEYLRRPRIDAVEPTEGILAGGQPVFIIGSNFSEDMTIEFVDDLNNPSLRAACATLTFINGSRLSCITPPAPDGIVGLYGVLGVDAAEQSTGLPAVYKYKAKPIITGVTHETTLIAKGPTSGGGLLIITGSGFVDDPRDGNPLTLKIGEMDCPIVSVGPAEVTCNLPASEEAETFTITVTNSDTQSFELGSAFTYTAPAEITEIKTVVGGNGFRDDVEADTDILITGSGFYGDIIIRIGTQDCLVSAASNTSITCQLDAFRSAPNPRAGLADVTLTNGDGQTTLVEDGFENRVVLSADDLTLECYEFGPEDKYCGHTSTNKRIRITDAKSRLFSNVKVKIEDRDCFSVQHQSDRNAITCWAPPMTTNEATVTISVSNGPVTTLTKTLTYYPQPPVTQISPNNRQNAYDHSVDITIDGSNYIHPEDGQLVTAVYVGTQSCGISSITSNQIQCQVPALTDAADIGRKDLRIRMVNSQEYTYSRVFLNHYRTDAMPEFTVRPSLASDQGGTRIYLEATGGNLSWLKMDDGTPLFGPISGSTGRGSITIGGVDCGSISSVNETTISCITSPFSGTGLQDIVVTRVDEQTTSILQDAMESTPITVVESAQLNSDPVTISRGIEQNLTFRFDSVHPNAHLASILFQDTSYCLPTSFKPSENQVVCRKKVGQSFPQNSVVRITLNGNIASIKDMFVSGADNFAYGHFGLAKKASGESFWQIFSETGGLSDNVVVDMSISGNTWLVATGSGVDLTENAGQNWTSFTTILGEDSDNAKVLISGARYIVGLRSGLYYSDDAGTTWSASFLPDASSQQVVDLELFNGSVVVAGKTGLYVSSDNGATFTAVTQFQNRRITSVKDNNGQLYLTSTAEIIRTTDLSDYQVLSNFADIELLSFDPDDSQIAILKTAESVYWTEDGLISWSEFNTDNVASELISGIGISNGMYRLYTARTTFQTTSTDNEFEQVFFQSYGNQFGSSNVTFRATPKATVSDTEGDDFGFAANTASIDIDGDGQDEIIVADPSAISGDKLEAGRVMIYSLVGNSWTMTGELTRSTVYAYQRFGTVLKSFRHNGTPYIAVGSPGNPDNDVKGRVYIYNLSDVSQEKHIISSANSDLGQLGISLTTCSVSSQIDMIAGRPDKNEAWLIELSTILAQNTKDLTLEGLEVASLASSKTGSGKFGTSVGCYNADEDAGYEIAVGSPEAGVLSQGKLEVFDNDFNTIIGQKTEASFKMRLGYRMHNLFIGNESYLVAMARGDYNPFFGAQRGYIEIFGKAENGSSNVLSQAIRRLCDENEDDECRSETLFGYGFAEIDDVDNDGIDDFAVSAPHIERDFGTSQPQVYLFRGSDWSPIGTIMIEDHGLFGVSISKVKWRHPTTNENQSGMIIGTSYDSDSLSKGRFATYELP
ncbi:MAG: IPT/TIG domain-containing protein [Pseudobacteriovorax sp.]|nr:IPT/TIG domain-containing protein [Pseudobacteriovorax sp.]